MNGFETSGNTRAKEEEEEEEEERAHLLFFSLVFAWKCSYQ